MAALDCFQVNEREFGLSIDPWPGFNRKSPRLPVKDRPRLWTASDEDRKIRVFPVDNGKTRRGRLILAAGLGTTQVE
ncbi:hypothetical protein [Microvirga subterranea]|uniref:hypothetical protein n=1 Tax=Microvirga subterranea TaxID=186651 RepID=UPI0011C06097|nr:hypothetical protein [Microvirga subterranea]